MVNIANGTNKTITHPPRVIIYIETYSQTNKLKQALLSFP
jgi:hypothetical protein